MIKKCILVLTGVLIFGMTTAVLAANHKETLWHCGCVAQDEGYPYATAYLRWTALTISKNAGGHKKHDRGDVEYCDFYNGTVTVTDNDIERGSDDCEPAGGYNWPGIADCGDNADVPDASPQAGEYCDEEYYD
jgi:hypothetical protein